MPPLNEDQIAARLIRMAVANVAQNQGGPFACLIFDGDGNEIGAGCNGVTARNDPTAHAEIVALREACARAGSFRLPSGSTVFTSCEPCPMCRGALLWADARRIVYVATRDDADRAGFDDKRFYDEWAAPRGIDISRLAHEAAFQPFAEWIAQPQKIPY